MEVVREKILLASDKIQMDPKHVDEALSEVAKLNWRLSFAPQRHSDRMNTSLGKWGKCETL